MPQVTNVFSGFSVDDLDAARAFYGDVLGLSVKEESMGFLSIELPAGGAVLVYPKPDHAPAVYTILNLQVEDVETAVDELTAQGVTMERYPEMPHQDEKGIARGREANLGPDIAWFKDPAGNILSVLTP